MQCINAKFARFQWSLNLAYSMLFGFWKNHIKALKYKKSKHIPKMQFVQYHFLSFFFFFDNLQANYQRNFKTILGSVYSENVKCKKYVSVYSQFTFHCIFTVQIFLTFYFHFCVKRIGVKCSHASVYITPFVQGFNRSQGVMKYRDGPCLGKQRFF